VDCNQITEYIQKLQTEENHKLSRPETKSDNPAVRKIKIKSRISHPVGSGGQRWIMSSLDIYDNEILGRYCPQQAGAKQFA